MREKLTTTHGAIFDYWKDKAIHYTGKVIPESEAVERYDVDDTIPVVYDWGEPCCWACGSYTVESMEEAEAWLEKHPDEPVKKMYNGKHVRHIFNRCHIVPDMQCGKPIPENLFLLCAKCHSESPDTTNPDNFFRWVYKRRTSIRRSSFEDGMDVLRELCYRGIGDYVIKDLELCYPPHPQDDNYSDYELGYLMKHAGYQNGRYSESTLMAIELDYIAARMRELSRVATSDDDVSIIQVLEYLTEHKEEYQWVNG